MKKLYKKQEGKMVCGVCGGIGDYFNIDPTLIRLVWALAACTGAGIVAYFIAAIVMPEENPII